MKNRRWSQIIIVVLSVLSFIPCFAVQTSVKNVYDDLNRLQSVEDYGSMTTTVYEYDEVGNRTSKSTIQQAVLVSTPGFNGSMDPGATITTQIDHSTGDYTWTIINQQPGTVAQIVGSATGNSVTVKALNPGTFQLRAIPAAGGSAMTGNTITVTGSQPNVKIAGTGNTYMTLQDAYNAAADGALILTQGINLTGNLLANRNISVRVDGGYDSSFTTKTGNTSLRGTIQTLTGGGSLTLGNIILVTAP